MLTNDEILETIEQHREQIRAHGVRELTLFGSFARGEASEDSDIDFLVEFEEGRGLFDDYVGLLHLLEDLFDRPVELVKRRLVRDELRDSILQGPRRDTAI